MKNLLRILCFLAASTVAWAQPRLSMKDTLDWGTVVPKGSLSETAHITATLTLTNVGTDTLDVKEVRPSCGCTSAPLKQNILPPGVSTDVTVTINLPTQNGPLTKYLTVISNDPYKSNRMVVLHANIERAVQLSSSFVGFNKGIVGLETDGEITFSNAGAEPFSITSAQGSTGVTVVTPLPATLQPKESVTLRVRYVPVNPGSFTIDLKVTTSHPDHPVFDLKGYGFAEKPPTR